MKVSTRDLFGKVLAEALADQVAAMALRCLVEYCRLVAQAPFAMSTSHLLLPVPAAERDQVLGLLKKHPLLSWDPQSGQVAFASAFLQERAESESKLMRYGRVLNEWQPDATASELRIALHKGVLLFNHHLFFEVHEILEAQWVKETGAVKRFLQGLIQIAVAFYHLENHNLRGAQSLLQDGLEKIAPHQPAFTGIELSPFVAHLQACQEELLRLSPDSPVQSWAGLIPQMHFAL